MALRSRSLPLDAASDGTFEREPDGLDSVVAVAHRTG
jgi:hypothetical protein